MKTLSASGTAPPSAARCLVHDLVIDAFLGIYQHEQDAAQRIRVNLDLDLAEPGMTADDGIAAVRAVIARGHAALSETLAERIAERCLADARVRAARVRVEKLDIFPDAVVGVEIERSRV